MKYASELSHIPKTDHFAIIESNRIHIPGDERSRTNPGHGYPESWETTFEYISFDSEAELVEYLTKQEQYPHSKKSFVIIKASPITYTTSVSLKLNK